MAELITLAIDVALGALAYRLARENRTAIQAVKDEVAFITLKLKEAGIL